MLEIDKGSHVQDTRIGRRSFLELVGRRVAGVTLIAAGLGVSASTQGCVEEDNLSRVDILTAIKHFEADSGNQALTFDQAKTKLPIISELFVRNSGSLKTARGIAGDTFIIRRDFRNPEEMQRAFNAVLTGKEDETLSNPVIRQLKTDYPTLNIPIGMATRLIFALTIGNARALVDSGKIFMVLDRVNESTLDSTGGKVTTDWQYQGSTLPVVCNPISPAVRLRSTLLHEMVHYEASAELQPLERAFLEAYQKTVKFSVTKGGKKNFAYVINDAGETEFNEFVTDYISAMISIKNGLPYTLGYGYKHTPSDHVNFTEVLNQSGIDEKDLFKMYKASQLEMLLIKIAKGAQNIRLQSEEEMYAFSIRHFLQFTPIIWPNLKRVFPKVDQSLYAFVDPSTFVPSDPRSYLWYDQETKEFSFRETILGCIR